MSQFVRLIWSGWLFRVRELTRSGLFLFITVIEPLIFATVTYYLLLYGHRTNFVVYSGLGAGMAGMWGATVYGSASTIGWQRFQRTLEFLVAAPPPFVATIFPLTLATSSVGIYSLTATLFWSEAVFGVPFDPVDPMLFVLAVVTTILALGTLGLVIATSFVLVHRKVMVLANLIEIPVWMLTGVLVPLALLPGWMQAIGWALAPTWGFRAIRESTFGDDPFTSTAISPLAAVGICVALTLPYLVLGFYFARVFERRARERATLSLI